MWGMINSRVVHYIGLLNKSHISHISYPMIIYEQYSNNKNKSEMQPQTTQIGNELFIQYEFSLL